MHKNIYAFSIKTIRVKSDADYFSAINEKYMGNLMKYWTTIYNLVGLPEADSKVKMWLKFCMANLPDGVLDPTLKAGMSAPLA